MPTGQLYPPHKLPGLDQFLTGPTALHDVHVTFGYTTGSGDPDINILAATADPNGQVYIPLAIRQADPRGPELIAVVGHRSASYNNGAVEPADLGLDRGTRDGAMLWAAFVELREAYRQANQIRDAYMAQFRGYVVAKLDNSTRYKSRPSKDISAHVAAGRVDHE